MCFSGKARSTGFFIFDISKVITLFSLALESFSYMHKSAFSSRFSFWKKERISGMSQKHSHVNGTWASVSSSNKDSTVCPQVSHLTLLCHNCSTCKFNNHLCHSSSSWGCFEYVVTGHLFDPFKKHPMPLDLWMCRPKCKLSYKTTSNSNISLLKETKGSQLKNARPKWHLKGLWDSQMKGFM